MGGLLDGTTQVGERMQRARSGRKLRLLSVAISAAVFATVSPAVAQDDDAPDASEAIDLEPIPNDQVVGPFKVDDGAYAGVVAYSYSLTMGPSGITLWLHRDGSGSATFEVADEAMAGEWTLTDSGGLSILERPGLAEADAVGSASGTLTGSFPYTFGGIYRSDVQATVDAGAAGGPSISGTGSSSDEVELVFELTETVQVCGQVLANWDESFRSQYLELGWQSSLKTQLVAFPAATADAIQERILALVESATFAANQMAGPESALAFMVDTLVNAESIMSDIASYPQTCPLDSGFLRIVNQILRDMMNTLLNRWEAQDEGARMIVLRRMVEVGLRGGILGSGSADPQSADVLEKKIVAIVQERFDELIDTTADEDELRQAIIVAEMLDHQLAEASNADLCLVLGGC